MRPMIAGMLITADVKYVASTPPISANGRLSSTTVDRIMLLNSVYSSTKTTSIATSVVSHRVRDAESALSNCPPYSRR